MSPVIVAVDPGITGAIAFLDPRNPTGATVHDMPRIADGVEPIELQRLIFENQATIAVLEKVTAMPSQPGANGKRRGMGAASAFNFGAAYATARTVLALCEIPLHPVVPGKWKRALQLAGGDDAKERARQRAIELFPHAQPALRRKMDHGRAEALLLAHYCATAILKTGGDR